MAIYSIDLTDGTSMITTLREAFDSAGILTTIHRETSTNLIITTTRSTRVLRFNADGVNKRFHTYYGTSYVSGDTIADSVTIANYTSGTGTSTGLIVTEDVVYLAEYRGGVIMVGVLIGNLNNVAETEIIWGWQTGGASKLHDATSRVQMEAVFYSREIISTSGSYYMSDIPCIDTLGTYMAGGVAGAKALHKSANYGSAYEIVGDDVIVPLNGANSVASYTTFGLYIPNGYSWTPP